MKLKFYFSGIILFFLLHGSLKSFCQKIDSATAAAFVPKDLKTDNKILLVKVNEIERKKIQEYEKQFGKNYIGLFEIVPRNVSIDKSYPDVKLYKYVLVISGALSQQDFNGISNRELFFDQKDSSFIYRGSSLFIFDRSSNHNLYETGLKTLAKGFVSIPQSTSSGNFSPRYGNDESTNFRRLKRYIEMLNDY